MVEERKAGFHGADVVETNAINLSFLSDEDVLVPYRGPSVSGLVEGSLHKDWTADRLNVFAVAWNTKLVPKGQEPKSWEDLADPHWKGKLLLQADDHEWFKTLWEHWVASGKTPAEADRLAEAIARNAIFIDGRSLGRELLAAGEFDVTVNLRHAVQSDADEGAPLAWQPAVELMFWRPNGVAAVNGSPNPAAAVLFMDWILADGQKVFEELETDPLPRSARRAVRRADPGQRRGLHHRARRVAREVRRPRSARREGSREPLAAKCPGRIFAGAVAYGSRRTTRSVLASRQILDMSWPAGPSCASPKRTASTTSRSSIAPTEGLTTIDRVGRAPSSSSTSW